MPGIFIYLFLLFFQLVHSDMVVEERVVRDRPTTDRRPNGVPQLPYVQSVTGNIYTCI